MVPVIAAAVVLAYLLGSIPFGLLVGRSRGIDIREHGSKNIGATNVWRVLGKGCGLFTFFCDAAKGWLAVIAGLWIAARWPGHGLESGYVGIAAAMGCILGHTFPVWLRGKGGKGVATSLGVIFGMVPLAALLTFAVWGVVFKVSRYVSLASIVAAVALPVIVIGLMFLGQIHGWSFFYFACAAALLVVRLHRDNIKRLVAGTESRFGATKQGPEGPGE